MATGKHNIHLWTHVGLPLHQVRWEEALTDGEVARLLSKIADPSPSGCWLWTGSVSGTGSVKHGQFAITRHDAQGRRQRPLKPHRVVWVLTHGPIPAGLCVCHHCDVPRCCNPTHLFLGTQASNLNDARWKGRLIDGIGAQKLSEAAYREILLTKARGVDLAEKYDVSETSIARIRMGLQGKRMRELILAPARRSA